MKNVDGRRTTTDVDGRRTPDHGYTISSPCEPEGSGELIMCCGFLLESSLQGDPSRNSQHMIFYGEILKTYHFNKLSYYIPRKAFHSVCIAENIEYFRY